MAREPSIDALIDAVQTYLRNEVRPRLDGFDAYSARVAANMLAIVKRQRAAEAAQLHLKSRLCALLPETQIAHVDHSLALGFRNRTVELTPALLAVLREQTMLQLAVDNPRYSGLREAQRRWRFAEDWHVNEE